MLGSDILDVAIGLIFVYLLVSLICSAVNEIVEAWLKRRASDLERGIRELLQDPSGTGLAKQLYSHPLVFGLFRGGYDPGRIKNGTYRTGAASELPSYIPARTFALALMDVLLPAAGNASGQSGTSGATAPAAGGGAGAGAGFKSSPLRTALAAAAEAGAAEAGAAEAEAEAEAAGAAGATTAGAATAGAAEAADQPYHPPSVASGLLALVEAAGGDPQKERENIENWYDGAMDRVSGWYKRRAQRSVLLVGLAVAVFLNVDTIGIARSLAADKPLRDAVVAEAAALARRVDAAAAATQPADPAGRTAAQADHAAATKQLSAATAELKSLGLPIGWQANPLTDAAELARVPFRIPGWLITAAAVSLGAAFWFDLLNKFMVIRSTVKPHEKSREEGSEDRR